MSTSKKIRDDQSRQTYVEGAKEVEVKSVREAYEQYFLGKDRRQLAQTELNFSSSRSHSIFQIRVVRVPVNAKTNEIEQDDRLLSISRLCLVDLAGSERANRTGATGGKLTEASGINTSLMALRRCIDALRKTQRGQVEHIPFRQKKIVHLFKPFFEGHGKISVLICVNPKESEAQETEHVLAFAESTQKVKTRTKQVVSMDLDSIENRKKMFESKDQALLAQQKKYKQDLKKI